MFQTKVGVILFITAKKKKKKDTIIDTTPASSKKAAAQGTPTNDTRFDGVDHLPLHREKR